MAMNTNESSDSSNSFFKEADPKLDEIKNALESDSISKKLENMKRLIAMISKGRDVRSLFPNVVKNVICDNLQVKRLVYMFLIHYAEFEQDLALLSINTFQKDLDNPSPLIRAQALRVLSSIRLRVITHILIISVKRCVVDSSPYVRKTAAHAIPKIYSLDHEKKEDLVDCIETLLGDNTTLVLGSAVAAFSEICPERIDLLHPHFRKICNVLADIDEWGQICVINVLCRYARLQFANPNPNEKEKAPKRRKAKSSSFYSDDDSEDISDDYDDYDDGFEMDTDHRLLLRATTPLLQSRNNGVVVAVAMLLYYCAPKAEALKAGKPLVRIARNPPQISYLVFCNIVTISQTRPEMFAPYLTEFYIYDSDPTYIRKLKLEILTNIATETNISGILREFTHYVKMNDSSFVTATIQAIGTSAARLPEVQETCMQRLIHLLSNPSDSIVAESVVVIKKLLQLGAGSDVKIIKHLAKILEKINAPKARASIIWIVGEYCKQIPTFAPDILRNLCKSFKQESKIVKLQILSLGAKLLLNNPNDKNINLMFQYICNMSKFDMHYDLRDRARVLRTILIGNLVPILQQKSLDLICSDKPAPEIIQYSEADSFALNSLSHIVNHTAYGYQPLSEWPDEIPDPSVRNQVARKQRNTYGLMPTNTSVDSKTGGFYSDEESSEYSDFTESYEDSNESNDDIDSFYGSSTKKTNKKSSSSSGGGFFNSPAKKQKKVDAFGFSEDEESEYSDEYSDDDDVNTNSSSNDFFGGFSTNNSNNTNQTKQADLVKKSTDLLNTDLLGLSLDSTPTNNMNTISPLMGSSSPVLKPNSVEPVRENRILLKQLIGQGLQVEYLFLRRSSMQGKNFCPIQVIFKNNSDNAIHDITIKGSNDNITPLEPINIIPAHSTAEGLMNIKFTSPTMPVKLSIIHQSNTYSAELQPPPGELISQSTSVTLSDFPNVQKKLGGMQEVSGKFKIDADNVVSRVCAIANVSVINDNGVYQFAGTTIIDEQTLLISVEIREGFARLKVNCSNAIFGTTLHRELKKILEKK